MRKCGRAVVPRGSPAPRPTRRTAHLLLRAVQELGALHYLVDRHYVVPVVVEAPERFRQLRGQLCQVNGAVRLLHKAHGGAGAGGASETGGAPMGT